jgi:hypothetical protein
VHTVSDQLAPVQFEATYPQRVALAADSGLLRQVYVNAVGHCAFTDADYVAAIDAMDHVVSAHHWTPGVSVAALNQSADLLGSSLGSGDFTAYQPTPLDVQNSIDR